MIVFSTTPWVKESVFSSVVIYPDPGIMLAAASVILTVSDVCAAKSAFYKQSEDVLVGPHKAGVGVWGWVAHQVSEVCVCAPCSPLFLDAKK